MTALTGVSDHARQRFVEHFGWCPSPEQWAAAVLSILDRTAVLMGVQHSDGPDRARERWRVSMGGQEVELWWSAAGSLVVTVKAARYGAVKPIQGRRRVKSNAAASKAYRRGVRAHWQGEDWA